ncbi:hypothetical protein [Rhizobium sp.]
MENRLSAYSLNWTFNGPSSKDAGPCWSSSRHGKTSTQMQDGRTIRIGGEYEDWYDPDFYIYNDVIVTDATGRVEIFGYSEDVFPPTDFHTATLVGDRIVVIGNLSYPSHRGDKVQVVVMDTSIYCIARLEALGEAPPWLHKHEAELVDDATAIVIRGGFFRDACWPTTVENIDNWRLDLVTWRWSRMTKRPWRRFALIRTVRKHNHLYWLRRLLKDRSQSRTASSDEWQRKFLADLGEAPRVDLVGALYVPELTHTAIDGNPDERGIHRISIDGVVVRYVESSWDIQLTIEGALPDELIARLCLGLSEKMSAIEESDVECISLDIDARS